MFSRQETVRAPAKVNLYLRVTGRRSDGYHLIDSLIVPVTAYDEIEIQVSQPVTGGSKATVIATSDSTELPSGPENLAYRAAEAFVAAAKQPVAVGIHIRKKIPIGSGLGGGSSDAAAVLLALNRLLACPLRSVQLAALGAAIGADVPFFIYGRPAIVTGVGEKIAPVTLGRSLPLVICSDGSALSTAAVYARFRETELTLTSAPVATNIAAFVEGRKPLKDLLVNDLEKAAAQIHPAVLSLKAKVIEKGAQTALMTGSGSAVFGLCPDLDSARNAAEMLRREGLWAEAVQTLETSPAVGS